MRQPVVRQPVVRQPVVRQPVVWQPVVRQPVIQRPVRHVCCAWLQADQQYHSETTSGMARRMRHVLDTVFDESWAQVRHAMGEACHR